ncbi:MAG: VanZ family protein [Eubacteriales bacterium]|nr:VanZ family protein [Eubacteriales bacterium]
MKKRDAAGALLLFVYLLGVGLLTGPSLYQMIAGRLPAPKLELVPFADIAKVLTDPGSPGLGVFANLAGNVLLFLPLGLLLPLFWRYFQRAGRTVLCGLALSVSIELIQLVSGGVTSVDDVLLNTLGAALGFALAKLALRLWPRLVPRRKGRAEWRWPLLCWLAVIAAATASDLLLWG